MKSFFGGDERRTKKGEINSKGKPKEKKGDENLFFFPDSIPFLVAEQE